VSIARAAWASTCHFLQEGLVGERGCASGEEGAAAASLAALLVVAFVRMR
jgi:uncharacterized protein (TIGR03382 family)